MTRVEYVRVPPFSSGRWQVGYHFQELFRDLDGALYLPDRPTDTAVIVMHPTVGFMSHYTLEPLAKRGFAGLGVNSRYAWNDSTLVIENVVLDLAAAVTFLRTQHGYERIVLLGNSGGSFITLYQSQAERPTITSTPAGDPPNLTEIALPGADALVLLNASRGRARVVTDWMDAAVTDERDLFATAPELDIFNPENGPPFTPEFVVKYRAAQAQRNDRISAWVLSELESHGQQSGYDAPFIVHRTSADPRFVDLTLDPSDRVVGSLRGEPKAANYAPTGLARFSTLRSWLSQWSLKHTNWDSEDALSAVSAPVLVIQGTADFGIFPSDAQALYDASPADKRRLEWIAGGAHYFEGQPALVEDVIEMITDWIRSSN